MNLPKGPNTPSLFNLFYYLFRPANFFNRYRTKYGVNFTAKLAGLGTFVFLGDPKAIREVYLGDPDVLLTGKANEFAADTLGSNSILLLDGEEHACQRKSLTPPFNHNHFEQYAPLMRDICIQEMNKWKVGKAIKLEDAFREIALQAILHMVFGIQQGDELDRLACNLRKITEHLSHPLAFAAPLLPKIFTRSIHKVQNEIDSSLYRFIDLKKDEKVTNNDILSIVLRMKTAKGVPLDKLAMRDHLFSMLMAGHDTTAIAMAWAIQDILLHPEVLNKIKQEFKNVIGDADITLDHIPKLKYFEAAIKESLRLHPLVDYSVRYLEYPFVANGIRYPAGIILAPCSLLVHMRPDNYPEPDKFNPDRFFNKKPGTYSWIPFGGGRRRCLGIKFAQFEMRIVLANVLHHAQFSSKSSGKIYVQRRGLFLAPSNKAKFILTDISLS